MTDALVQFLRARLTEDEEIARGHEQWSASWHQDDLVNEIRDDENAGTVAHVFRLGDRTHIARHDPKRVLAEVDAKRRILDEVVPAINALDDRIDLECGRPSGYPRVYQSEDLLRALALPYASHPEYREEWAL